MGLRFIRGSRARLVLLPVSFLVFAGCSATSVYKKAAKIGLELVGDAVAEDEAQTEFNQIAGRGAADADRRFGQPRGVFRDDASGREVRVYDAKDLLGKKRWVVELANGRVDALSQAEVNPDLGKDKAKALMLESALKGKTPEEVRETPVMDKLIFKTQPRSLKRVPSGELVQVYNVTSALDITGSRFLVLGYDAAGRCEAVRYVGTP